MRVLAAQLFTVGSDGPLVPVAAVGVPASIVDTPRDALSQTAAAARHGAPLLIADWSQEQAFAAPGAVLGLGIGSTALRLLAAYLTTTLRWPAVTIDPERTNAQAIRAFAKAGFVEVDYQRSICNRSLLTARKRS